MLRVRLLGGLSLERDDGHVPVPGGRCGALLAWLALHPGMQPRARVAAQMWPDVLDESARGSLRTALLDLRAALGVDAARHLVATRDAVGLGPGVRVDVREFAAAVAAGRWQEALAIGGGGELLPELQHEWVFDARDAHARELAEVIERLAAAEEAHGDLTAAIERTRRLVALDPLSEERARALIRRLADAGDRAAAMSAFDAHRDRLRTQLQMAPSAATRELIAQIRAGPVAEAPGSARPLPGPLALAAEGPLIGRDAEVDTLQAAWSAVGDGTVRVCVLTGEAGIGKSRLVAELARRVATDGAPVLYGACFEDPRPPYGPLVDAITDDLRDLGDEQALAQLGADTGELARIAPEVRDRFGVTVPASGESPEGDQVRLFTAVGRYLQRVAAPRALVVTEDVHWAATATFALIAHIVRSARGAILLAITSRDVAPDLSDALSVFLADLGRLPNAQVIRLAGLTELDVAALLGTGDHGQADVERTARRLHEATRGNPLFLREMVRDLPADGSAVPIAASVRDHVAARIVRLPKPDRELLDAAAVLGTTFDAWACAETAGRPLPDVLDVLDRAAEAGIVVAVPGEPGRFAFTHAVLREVRYETIPAGRRMRLHHAAGLSLRETGAPVDELARHFCASADLGDAEEAYRYARSAGELARERFAFADAAAAFEQAQQVAARLTAIDDRERCELAIARGEALHRAGDLRYLEVLLEAVAAARRLDDADLLTRAALAFNEEGWSISTAGVEEDVVAAARDAIARLPQDAQAARARLLAAMAATMIMSPRIDEGNALAAEALEAARASGDPSALGEVLITAHWACFDPLNLDQRLGWAQEACELGERLNKPVLVGQAFRMLGQDRLELADLEGARAAFDRADRIAAELDAPFLRIFVSASRAALALLAGQLDEAERLVADGSTLGSRTGAGVPAGPGLSVAIERGRWEDAAAGLDAAVQGTRVMPVQRAALAMFHARLGNADAAARQLEHFRPTEFAIPWRNVHWFPGMVMLADAATWLRDAAVAARIRDHLEPVSGRTAWNAFTALWPIDVALARLCVVLGDYAAAKAHLDAAEEICQRYDLVAHQARVQIYRAWAQREAGEPADAGPAITAARACPCPGVAREVELTGL